MPHRNKTLSERQLRDIAALTDNSGGAASDIIAAAINIASLTDNSGGTADNTIEAVGDTSTSNEGAAINNNFAEVAEELAAQRALNTVLINAIASLSDKLNDVLGAIKNDA